MHLDFRAPGHAMRLSALLARALPGGSEERLQQLVRDAAVRVDGRPATRAKQTIAAGARLLVRCAESEFEAPPVRDDPDQEWAVLTAAPAWRRGVLAPLPEGKPHSLEFEVYERRGALAELRLRGVASRALETLASAGMPVLGDLQHGGIAVAGGLRWRLASANPDDDDVDDDRAWWPREPVFLGVDEHEGRYPILSVSSATRRALEHGHPWILRDRETGDTAPFAAGSLVELCSGGGASLGLARVEGSGRIAGRMWAIGVRRAREAASVEARVARALQRRESLLATDGSVAGTDALRLVHGEADGLPGLAVDRLGPLLRVLVQGRSCEGFLDRALDALGVGLRDLLGADPPVVRVTQLRERPAGRLECVHLARGALEAIGSRADGRLCVQERGLRFLVDPGLGTPERAVPGVGLYLDQRDNRERLARLAAGGGRWLNLFAHTGAFSVALLAAGAEEVVSVDLSGAYLRWLEENLALNGLDEARHRTVRSDGPRHLTRMAPGESFRGILIDPPTAAAAGRHYWSVARGLESLVEEAMRHLEPGGVLFVSRNDRRGRDPLADLAGRAASRARRVLRSTRAMPPPADFPKLAGFPEGDAFRAVLATLD